MRDMKRRETLRLLARATVTAAVPPIVGCDRSCPTTEPSLPEACAPTQPDVEGPFYTADAPTKNDGLIEPGDTAEPLIIRGTIVDASDCGVGLAGYILDLWHADADGNYDNEGFRYRGRVVADDDGAYWVETIMPGSYPDRPVRHVHLKVLRPDGTSVITTQIYFEGDPNLDCDHVGPRVSPRDGVAELDFVVDA